MKRSSPLRVHRKFSASPTHVLYDEKIHVTLSFMSSKCPVTLYSYVDDENKRFYAIGHYLTDSEGNLDVDNASSKGGTYTGIDGMGLFWSMVPKPGQKKGIRLLKQDVTTPSTVNIYVYDGHINESAINNAVAILSTRVFRTYLSDAVERKVVEIGRIRGTLFLPKGPGVYPGVIDLYGSVGGCIEHRAALLASKGFTCLALAYFGYKDLPNDFKSLDLGYFQEAIKWLLEQRSVVSDSIGIVGTSYGALLAYYIAQHCHQVKALVSISYGLIPLASCRKIDGILKVEGKCHDFGQLISSGMLSDLAESSDDGQLILNHFPSRSAAQFQDETNCKLADISANWLVINGDGDLNVHPSSGRKLAQELTFLGKKVYSKVYEKTGHLIEPPYGTHCSMSWHRSVGNYMVWGGDPKHQIKAEVDFWDTLIQFLRVNLNSNASRL